MAVAVVRDVRLRPGTMGRVSAHTHSAIAHLLLHPLQAMAICVPFGFLNLEENMWFQVRHT